MTQLAFARTAVAAAALAASSLAAQAAPVYVTAIAVLPGGLATLQAARSTWASNAAGLGAALSTEGFESFSAGNPINFGPFIATLTNGTGFTQESGNNLITTQGSSVLQFVSSSTSLTSVEFVFGTAINAFGVDITSIDRPDLTVTFLDDLGNTVGGLASGQTTARALFFGVTNATAFTKARFTFNEVDTLNFDNLQWGSAGATVPEPGSLMLVALAILGLVAVQRQRAGR